MGTRADFYIEDEDQLHWIGSQAWDGNPGGMPSAILEATDTQAYRRAVEEHLHGLDDATFPEQGWPWPWETSRTTDYAYIQRGGKTLASFFGRKWFDAQNPPEDENYESEEMVDFPDMTAIQKIDFGRRSGTMIFGFPKED